MNIVVEYRNGKPMVKTLETLCSALEENKQDENLKIMDFFKSIDEEILSKHPDVTAGGLSSCHGYWYEAIISLIAWNHFATNQTSNLVIPLPNISQFDISTLYEEELSSYLSELKSKVMEITGVSLISSNPDFVIISRNAVESAKLKIRPLTATPENFKKIQDYHKGLVGCCGFDEIIGYLSVKTSLRSDRRLQICHEGSLFKSMYSHLKTRSWDINAKGIFYYAAATSLNESDIKALRTVATHSLSNVHEIPQSAVDAAYKADTLTSIYRMIDHISA
ncbi:restriction endonuclease [Vibrio parahaemolyticus]|nr:restriction endonuclease [Vibrio parahaemolyticus]